VKLANMHRGCIVGNSTEKCEFPNVEGWLQFEIKFIDCNRIYFFNYAGQIFCAICSLVEVYISILSFM
jgi:hypothetical protein